MRPLQPDRPARGVAPAFQPYLIGTKAGGPFAFAGRWERWFGPGGTAIESSTIVTTDANELVRPIHDRMPAIVPPTQPPSLPDLG